MGDPSAAAPSFPVLKNRKKGVKAKARAAPSPIPLRISALRSKTSAGRTMPSARTPFGQASIQARQRTQRSLSIFLSFTDRHPVGQIRSHRPQPEQGFSVNLSARTGCEEKSPRKVPTGQRVSQ